MAAATPASNRWLYGPLPDLLLGCGLLYTVIWVGSLVVGETLRGAQPALLFPVLILLLSMPHYGATLVRVYDQRESRRGYVVFSVYATLGVAAAFVAGTYNATVAIWMVTIYLTWSPWHYTGQNYGLAVMFLRRRGVPLPDGVKRLVYACFGLSYVLTFLTLHGERAAPVNRPALYQDGSIVFRPLGIPGSALEVLVPLVAAAYVIVLVVAGVLLLRRARPIDLAPTAALVLTQALWFAVPLIPRWWPGTAVVEPMNPLHRLHYFQWILLGHSVQYLWVTSYFARGEAEWGGYARYFAKLAVAGIAIWHLPVLFFAPDRIGHLSWFTGLPLLLAAAINIHHFILDGAIWKLRSGRIASILIRGSTETSESESAGSRWPRRMVWASATAGFALGLFVFWDLTVVHPRALARADYPAAHAVVDRMSWFGFGGDELRRHTRMAERRHLQELRSQAP